MKNSLLIILGFILGFITATYWKSGRELLVENAPTVHKHLEKGVNKGKEALKDGATMAKDKIKKSL